MKKTVTAVLLVLVAVLCLGLIIFRLTAVSAIRELPADEAPSALAGALPASEAPANEDPLSLSEAPANEAPPALSEAPASSPSPVPAASVQSAAAPVPSQLQSPTPALQEQPPYPEPWLYSFGVEAGKVRYVSQAMDLEDNGWGKYSWKAGMECTTACISMALSYLGVDESPEELLDFSSKTYLCSTYGLDDEISVSPFSAASYSQEEVPAAFRAMAELYFSSADGSVSPVLVYLSGCGHNHAILLIGREAEQYYVLDPAFLGIFKISVSDTGEITAEDPEYLSRYTNGGETPAKLAGLGQWIRTGTV